MEGRGREGRQAGDDAAEGARRYLQAGDPKLQLIRCVGAEEHLARGALARVLVLVVVAVVQVEVAERRGQRCRELLLLGGGGAAGAAGGVLRGRLAEESQLERVQRELEHAHLRRRGVQER